MEDKLLTAVKAAEFLGVSVRTLSRWTKKGVVKSEKEIIWTDGKRSTKSYRLSVLQAVGDKEPEVPFDDLTQRKDLIKNLTRIQAAKYLQIGLNTFDGLVKEGRIKGAILKTCKNGKKIRRFSIRDLNKLFKAEKK